ncbi:MAG: universal stress protein [Catenulispora sp.]|nr:universal stress protein [Catenulispora sp.]
MNGTVVVGLADTAQSGRTLALAEREAADRGDTLAVVRGCRPPSWIAPARGPGAEPSRTRPGDTPEAATARSRHGHPHKGPVLGVRAGSGEAADAFAAASRDADLVVVEDRAGADVAGHGRKGAVVAGLLAAARCPAIIVRGPNRPVQNRLLVAIDVEGPCEAVLAFAFDEADRRGADLTILNIWSEPQLYDYREGPERHRMVAAHKRRHEAAIGAVVQSWRDEYPHVPVTVRVTTGAIGDTLLRTANTADLAIIGARWRSPGRSGLRVGPAAYTLLRHSACPVALVPLDSAGHEPTG